MTWIYAAPKTDQLPWDKIQTHAFSVKANAPLSDSVTPTHPDETKLSYKLQSSRTAAIGVGVGVIYTGISQPSWDAVTDPRNSSQKVIAQTDASTLAGQLGIFADWRLLSLINASTEQWFVRPSLQFGANASSNAGFFLGFGFDVFKYFRFGIGTTWQQSKMLNGLQSDDVNSPTVVASKDDIKTKDVFVHDRYISFSFALDSLPLFKKSGSAGTSDSGSSKKSKSGQQ